MRAVVLSVLAVSSFATSAAAIDMPARKPGLWDLTMNFQDRSMPPQNIKQCIDAQTDKMMNSPTGGNPMARQQCSRNDVQQVGNTIVVDSVCIVAGATTTSHAVVTGDFNSAYTVQVDSTHQGRPASKMSLSAKWLGPCAAGQRPGDMIMQGMTINILDMQRGGIPGGMQGMPRNMPVR